MKAHKVDGNQARIVKALRKAGCSVHVTSDQAHGFPDLVVGRYTVRRGAQTFLLECKESRSGKLTPAQEKFHAGFKGHKAIVHDEWEALVAVGIVP